MRPYSIKHLALSAFMALIIGCNPVIIHPTATIPLTSMGTNTPLPIDTPSPTPLPIVETFTDIPPLTVDYDLTYRCNGNKAIYYIIFYPSGGVPDYTFSPSETFIAKPGTSKEAKVTSADGQTWLMHVPITANNCKKASGGGGSPGGPTVGNDDPAPVVPTCEPRGKSGKCKKK